MLTSTASHDVPPRSALPVSNKVTAPLKAPRRRHTDLDPSDDPPSEGSHLRHFMVGWSIVITTMLATAVVLTVIAIQSQP